MDITILDLGDFEDLYYATCAKLKELLQEMDVRLTNGFKSPHETYFVYHCPRFDKLDSVRVGEFRASLTIYEKILYSNGLTELLNKGVMRKSMRNNRLDSHRQLVDARSKVENDAEHVQPRHGVFQMTLGWLKGIGGLQDTRNMSCSMIYASLAEKYRPIVVGDGSRGSSITRHTTPDVPQVFEQAQLNQTYISPYNLEERFKKLNAPGAPEMPCICDPECLCAAVCASDPTQNCLCEENGLFTRVTQGVDIDDLDVPDLVRRSRQGSEISENGVVSLLSDIEILTRSPPNITHTAAVGKLSHDHCMAIEKVKREIQELQHEMQNDAEMIDAIPMDSLLSVSYVNNDGIWESQGITPPRVSSLSYRDALRQPFSKQCDYPPRRVSLAQRLFNSRSSGTLASKKASSGPASKVLKQMSKRPFADKSFASLKLAVRRDPRVHSTKAKK